MTKQAQTTDGTPPMPFGWMATLNNSTLNSFTRAAEACGKAGMAWQQELTRFTTARLQRDGELGQKLLSAQNWADAMRIQQDWIKSAGQDYAEEANRLMQMAQKVSAEMMQPPQAESEQTSRHIRGAAE